jgi:hypothetical protein
VRGGKTQAHCWQDLFCRRWQKEKKLGAALPQYIALLYNLYWTSVVVFFCFFFWPTQRMCGEGKEKVMVVIFMFPPFPYLVGRYRAASWNKSNR